MTVLDSDGQLELGAEAPDFFLPGVDGRTCSLEDYRGKAKALGVIFWCNHCPYVIKWEERMIELGKAYRDKGVEFVLVGSNNEMTHPQDSFPEMQKRAQQKGYPFPYLRDEDQSVAHAYGAKTTPHVFLFDGDMKLVFRGAIDDNVDDPSGVTQTYLKDAIEAVLAGQAREIEQKNTRPVGCSVKWK